MRSARESEAFDEVTLTEATLLADWSRYRRRSGSVSPAFGLCRLLLGGVAVRFDGHEFAQMVNYMAVGAVQGAALSLHDRVKAALPTLGIQDRNGDFLLYSAMPAVRKYLSDPGGNHSFFTSLLDEVARAVVCLDLERGLSAFVHLYRALEKLSFAFPLYHARQNASYMKAYDQLKGYFKGGELEFCSNFSRQLLSRDPLLAGEVCRMEFNDPISPRIVAYINEKNRQATVSGGQSIDVCLKDAFDFLVTLRNHYFHHLAGSNYSLDSRDVPRPDVFFLHPTRVGLRLIGAIFSKMVEDSV